MVGASPAAIRRRRLFDALASLNAAALLASSLYLYALGAEAGFAVMSVVVLGAFIAFWIALRRVDLPVWAILLLQLTILAHFFGRYVFIEGLPIYAYRLAGVRIDKIVHVLNAAAGSALVVLLARRAALDMRGWEGFFVVGVVCGLGTLIELIEYATFVFAPVSFAGDYANNMQDLAANLIGAVAGYVVARLVLPRSADA
jgi:hypothetical protein